MNFETERIEEQTRQMDGFFVTTFLTHYVKLIMKTVAVGHIQVLISRAILKTSALGASVSSRNPVLGPETIISNVPIVSTRCNDLEKKKQNFDFEGHIRSCLAGIPACYF